MQFLIDAIQFNEFVAILCVPLSEAIHQPNPKPKSEKKSWNEYKFGQKKMSIHENKV